MRRATTFAAATFFIGMTLTMVVSVLAYNNARDRIGDRFEESAAQVGAAIEAQLASDLNELQNVGAFVLTATPSSEQFDQFVAAAHLVDHFDSLTGLFVLDRVEERDLGSYVERQRQTRPDFTVVELGEHPAGLPHFVLSYYAPGQLGVKLPTGIDVSALITIRAEIEPRSHTGDAFAGAIQKEPLIQDAVKDLSETEYGELFRTFEFLIATPVYAPGRSAANGDVATMWVAAPVGRIDDVLRRGLVGQPADLGVQQVFDVTPELEQLGVDRGAERTNPEGSVDEAGFHHEARHELQGLRWTLRLWSSPSSDDPPYILLTFVLIVGSIASAVSAIAVYLRTRGRVREDAYARLAAAHERAELQRDILASVSEAVVVLDEEGRIVVGNHSWEELLIDCEQSLTDTLPEDALGARYLDVIEDVAVERTGLAGLDAILVGESEALEAEIVLSVRGEHRWLEIVATPLHGSDGAVIVHRDITDDRRDRQELEQRARKDPLTGLLNRAALEEQAREVVDNARTFGAPVGALFIDLDGFKRINDTHGHDFGDRVLCAVAQRIQRSVRGSDLVARQGGDEFVVLLNPLPEEKTANDLAARLLSTLNRPFAYEGVSVPVSASIGVVVLSNRLDVSVANLVRRADEAMYESKQRGGATYTVSV